MILMTGKNKYLYNKVLHDLKSILKDNGIDLKTIPKRFMVDFERGLINSVKKNFENSTIDRCFFHFLKLLWNKAKLLGQCKSGKLKMTKILIFKLKIISFIEYDDHQKFFEKIEEYYSLGDDGYKNFVSYYKKNWLKNNYINFVNLNNDEYITKINNYIENYNKLINDSLECYHPKISYLISKYKDFLINSIKK